MMADDLHRQLTIMTFENTRLAVPLSDVRSIEGVVDIELTPSDDSALGQLQHRGHYYSVYALSSRFERLTAIPEPQTVCVCLGADEGAVRLAIVCESVESVKLERGAVRQALPDCMQSTDSPLRELCEYNQQLVLISKADLLAAYLTRKE